MKRIKKSKNKLLIGWGVSFLAFISCLTIGYSSWSVSSDSPNVHIDSSIGGLNEFDYKSSIFYIMNSELGFSSFEIEDGENISGVFTNTNFSLRIKVNPVYVFDNFGNETDVRCYFGLTYSIRTLLYYNFFVSNTYVEAPKNFICMIEKNNSRYVYSEDLIFTSSESNAITTSTLIGEVSLYKLYGRSLYSITKDYSTKSTDYIYLNIVFPFKIDNSIYSKVKNFSVNFITSVKGANS